MRERRARTAEHELCSGPGKTCEALGIGLEVDGAPLTEPPFELRGRESEWEAVSVVAGPRIGITKAIERPWRFCAAANPHVSRPQPVV
jgi:DNA-3-methyladenine glycosylase